ncbi:MAG: hypothetical protein ACOYLT_09395 [Flavobacterium sp.]|uniref:hypothetical protein n=1 Tax=Flavobacterium sp. TaxID=239 RepID=UPI003BDA9744
MKKILYLFSISFLMLQSCSSDDNNSSNSTSVLVKKIIETSPDGVFTTIFTYNGNKIADATFSVTGSIASTGSFTYTGDLITKVDIFDNTNTLVGRSIYNYNLDNKLASFVVLNYANDSGRRATYTYNSDGTISSSEYEGDLTSQTTLNETKTIIFNNGEVSSLVENIGSITETNSFTYDNKNSPFKNVLGSDKLSYAVFGTLTSEINHNLIKMDTSIGTSNFVSNWQYTYNSNDYPTLKSSVENPNETKQFFY